jgi:hypothetical protein
MTQIHWSKANRSKHYGGIGYDMLSYKPDLDQTPFIEGMSFNEESRKRCQAALTIDLARLLRDSYKEGVTFKHFLSGITNKIMATAPMVQDVIWEICQTKEFEMRCPSGKTKTTAKLADADIIMPRQQFYFESLGVPNLSNKSKAKP